MERSEPTLVPEWLRSAGSVAGAGTSAQHFPSSSTHNGNLDILSVLCTFVILLFYLIQNAMYAYCFFMATSLSFLVAIIFLTLHDRSCGNIFFTVTAIVAAFVCNLHNLKPSVLILLMCFTIEKGKKILTVMALLCRFSFCSPSRKE